MSPHASAYRTVPRIVGMTVVLLLAACAGTNAASAPKDRPSGPMISVTVRSAGQERAVRIPAGSTVTKALAAARVTPADGRLLSALTHRLLDGNHRPATVTLDGRKATMSTPIDHATTLVLRNGRDVIEPLATATKPVRPPGLPTTLSHVHTSGRPGTARVVQGTISGEVVRSTPKLAPEPSSPVGGKVVSLTFDDGPSPATPQILSILRAKDVPAVFCLIGRQVRQNVEIVRSELADGHQICNHTLDHDERLATAPAARVESEIHGGLNAITDAGLPPPAFYRPPGGELSDTVYATADKVGEQVLYWSVDPDDWRRTPAATIVARVISRVKSGDIVLLHDGGGHREDTITALPILIDLLRAAGYTFTLPLQNSRT